MKDNITKLIGERVRDARDSKKINQANMAELLGLNDHQIISNIERGERKVSSDELINLMRILDKPLEYFTDPFLITQEKVFSWRVNSEAILPAEYEEKAKKLIAAYREFSRMIGHRISALSQKMQITKQSTYEEVEDIAEFLVEEWKLSDIPYDNLRKVLEENLHIPVLYVDAPKNISGASCKLDNLNCILINRNEPVGRQSFNLAHELFHLLTWDVYPPKRIDQAQIEPKPKEEKLADKFASVLLMPKKSISNYFNSLDPEEDLLKRLEKVANHFHVSVSAAYWRLFILNLVQRVDDKYYKKEIECHSVDTDIKPPLYSESFVKILHDVIHKGMASIRKVTSLLECSQNDLESLFKSYELKGLYE
ncbi:MAG TPA: hypothetical protein DET40_08835 [Lentisphaeria bacterium]|nr:MAG: hypothetical protein A2X45_19510 [Lentisphaerae bacterium GWF2_50_93]HCE43640.1 hypothetical protein [Lentisphaeria bacterium]